MPSVKYHEGKFAKTLLDWMRLLPLVGPANAAVARYESTLHGLPDVEVLLSPLVLQEAVLSTKIEGIQATLSEVLEFEAAQETASGEKRNDIQEVLNYRRAMRSTVAVLKKLSLSQRVVRDTHQVLMGGGRGESKTPGEYRRISNWIGPPGSVVEPARFVFPAADQVPKLMSDWEKYLRLDAPDKLVQLAILHAEFKAIHPFLDGNGRIGRLLVPLFLVDKGLLTRPDFYVSGYLEARREEYYDRLLRVSRDGDWTGWCTFFLTAMTEQARDNESKVKAILALYQSKKDWMTEKTHSRYAVRALDWFFNHPIFKTSEFVASVDITKPTANRIIRVVRDEGLLRELRAGSGRRAAILAFPELLNIVEGRTVF